MNTFIEVVGGFVLWLGPAIAAFILLVWTAHLQVKAKNNKKKEK